MLTTVEEVKRLTGYEVTNDNIYSAQALIESFAGKTEDEIQSVDDRTLMSRAVVYQAAYMRDNYQRIFEQIAVIQIAQADGGLTIDRDMFSPYIAPLAVLTLRRLSWRKSRSVQTGSIFGKTQRTSWWTD
jgi:hypothetical protein